MITVAPGWWPWARCGLRQSAGGGGPGRRRGGRRIPRWAVGGLRGRRCRMRENRGCPVDLAGRWGEDLVQGVELPGMDRRFAEKPNVRANWGLLTQTLGLLHVGVD